VQVEAGNRYFVEKSCNTTLSVVFKSVFEPKHRGDDVLINVMQKVLLLIDHSSVGSYLLGR
jgi:hypothetical protein